MPSLGLRQSRASPFAAFLQVACDSGVGAHEISGKFESESSLIVVIVVVAVAVVHTLPCDV